MQPSPLTSLMQAMITLCAVCVAAAAITFTVVTARQERNAASVRIGIAVLRADPGKESQVTAAREWTLDLIDANAGGVKFSPSARKEFLERRLGFHGSNDFEPYGSADLYPVPPQPKKMPPPNSD